MTFNWPKRDEEGRHVTDTGESYIIGECGGPEIKPLSELLAKLDPDVVEQARADANSSIECNVCKGHIRYYTFDYTKGVYVTNYCEHL